MGEGDQPKRIGGEDLYTATLAHLWVGAPPPPEFLEVWLVREVYHQWPLPPPLVVGRHLTVLAAEAEIKRRQST